MNKAPHTAPYFLSLNQKLRMVLIKQHIKKFVMRNDKNRFAIHANTGNENTSRQRFKTDMTNMNASAENPIAFDIVIPSMITPNLKHMLRQVAGAASSAIGIRDRILLDRLNEKERDNPSAMGDGISILHLHLSGLRKPMNIFVRLKNPIDMGAADKVGVDIVCLLLTPEREGAAYLPIFARLSRMLRNQNTGIKIRAAIDERAIRNILEQTPSQKLAA